MTASFQLTSSNLQFSTVASFAEDINIAKAVGFCPQLITDNCILEIATEGSV